MGTWYPRLFGGVFFSLLTEFRTDRKGRGSANESEMLADLIRVVDPDFEIKIAGSFKTFTSGYKNCKIANSIDLPLIAPEFVELFRDEMENHYEVMLRRMDTFCEKYFPQTSYSSVQIKRLFGSLIHIIATDRSIDPNVCFYVRYGGMAYTKSELINLKRFQAQPFLLGVWFFIITERPGNIRGRETCEKLHSMSNGASPFVDDGELDSIYIEHVKFTEDELSSGRIQDKKKFGQIQGQLSGYDYAAYLLNAHEKYSKIKTLLYRNEPEPFYNFYVCNDLGKKSIYEVGHHIDEDEINERADTFTFSNVLEMVQKSSRFVIIAGSAGIGKTMMMRHLLLDTISKYTEVRLVPFFASLKLFRPNEGGSLESFVYESIHSLCDVSEQEFRQTLKRGEALLLMDGIDEIKTEYREEFERALESMTDAYSNNIYVLSSRPNQSFISFNRFSMLYLWPFTREQALDLVDSLRYREDEPNIKNEFHRLLGQKLFDTHREFAENPLLLTIMLMTFEQYGDVPSKMHVFYKEAYYTLARQHDAYKGSYFRVFQSGLTVERMLDYLAEFCVHAYYQDAFEFTQESFAECFSTMREAKKYDRENVTAEQFLYDLQYNLCLLYSEGNRYHFIHRSFEEYFCALFFSKQRDSSLYDAAKFLDKRCDEWSDDSTFEMLCLMIPDKTEEFIYLPMLNDYLEGGYWEFVKRAYEHIRYGFSAEGEVFPVYSNSQLINDLVLKRLGEIPLMPVNMPYYFDVNTSSSEPNPDLYFKIDDAYYLRDDWNAGENFISDMRGFSMPFVLSRPKKFEKLIARIEDDDFPIKIIYKELLSYRDEIMTKKTKAGNSFFDNFY